MGKRPVRFAASIAVFAMLGACAKLIGADFDNVEPAETCNFAHPPASTMHTPSGGDAEVWLVANTFIFGEDSTNGGTQGSSQGFDLDNVCSAPGSMKPCAPPAYTHGVPVDGPGGVDNAVAELVIGQVTQLKLDPAPVNSQMMTAGVQAGKFAPLLLLHISGWTGFDDDQVRVELYVPVAPEKAQAPFTPKFDGSDAWPVLEASFDGSGPAGTPLVFVDENAYVTSRKLVAHFSKLYLPLVSVYFEGHDAVLVGRLDPSGGSFAMAEGVVAGWSPADDLLVLLSGISSALFVGKVICTDMTGLYDGQMKPYLCGKADMLVGGKPGDACNAFSFGVGFATAPVKLGPAIPAPPPAKECPPEYDPAKDSCSKAPVSNDGGA